jgi:hypothetical protein
MSKDIRFLLVFLIVALAVLVWLQNQSCNAIPNKGAIQYFTSDQLTGSEQSNQALKMKQAEDKARAILESNKVTSKIVDNILKSEQANKINNIINSQDLSSMNSQMSNNVNNQFANPTLEDVNNDRNSMSSSQAALEALIQDVNTGNNLLVDSPKGQLYRDKSKSIDAAPPGTYRKVSYKDSKYRYDFENDGSPSQSSQDELNSLYDDALIFKNNEYLNNNGYTGFNDMQATFGDANLKDFTPMGKQTQQEKVMALYNSNEYLPNNDLLDNKLTKGFQILENPVSVSNPNLIPVLKSIPVSSIIGSKRNSTWDIRAEPPCPKTVVSPFLNSSIMPDIYATQRGCL